MELGYLNEVKEDKKLEFKIIAIKPITSNLTIETPTVNRVKSIYRLKESNI